MSNDTTTTVQGTYLEADENKAPGLTSTAKTTLTTTFNATTSVANAISTTAVASDKLARAGKHYATSAEYSARISAMESILEYKVKLKSLAQQYGISIEEVEQLLNE